MERIIPKFANKNAKVPQKIRMTRVFPKKKQATRNENLQGVASCKYVQGYNEAQRMISIYDRISSINPEIMGG